MPFFIIFVVIPIVEIMLFMSIGGEIGFFNTLLLAFVTAVIGGWIVKYQGLETLMSARKSMAAQQFPALEIFSGFCLIAAGATLITPGFLTDAIGFMLLIPAVRRAAYSFMKDRVNIQTFGMPNTNQTRQSAQSKPVKDANVLEGEFETVDTDDKL